MGDEKSCKTTEIQLDNEAKPKRRGGFQPGVSGNPNGRPKKGNTFAEAIEKVLQEEIARNNGEMIPKKEAVARALVQLAFKGDVRAIKEIGDRIDGTPRQTIDANVKTDTVVVIGAAPVIGEEEDTSGEGE